LSHVLFIILYKKWLFSKKAQSRFLVILRLDRRMTKMKKFGQSMI